jgi:outer membrane protein TolC
MPRRIPTLAAASLVLAAVSATAAEAPAIVQRTSVELRMDWGGLGMAAGASDIVQRTSVKLRMDRGGLGMAAEAPAIVQRIGALHAARMTLEQGGEFQARVAELALQWRHMIDVARGEFRPKASVTLTSQRQANSATATSDSSTLTNQAGLATSWKLPSGMQLNAQLNGNRQRQSELGYSGGRTTSIALVLPLLRGSGYKINGATLRSTELALESARIGFRQAAADAVHQTLALYFNRRMALLQAEVARETLQSANQVDDLTRTMIQVGRSAAVAGLQSRADLAQAEIAVAQGANAERQALRTLLIAIGLELPEEGTTVETPDSPDETLPPLTFDESEAAALALQSDATALNARIALQQAHLSLLVAEDNLRLPLQFELSRSNSRSSLDGLGRGGTAVGLSTSIELNRVELRHARSSAAVALRRAEAEVRDAERNARIAAVDAVRQQEFAARQLALTQANIELARQRYEAELDRFRMGRASALELSVAQQAMTLSRVQLLQSQFEVLTARLGVLKVTGRLLDAVGLQALVERWSRGEP